MSQFSLILQNNYPLIIADLANNHSGDVELAKEMIAELSKMKAEQKAIVIDVRTPEEWQQGVISDADLFIDYKSASFQQQLAKLDKSKTYIVYCRSGGRSAGASQVMVDSGFKNVINMQGGISSWGGKIVAKP